MWTNKWFTFIVIQWVGESVKLVTYSTPTETVLSVFFEIFFAAEMEMCTEQTL